VSRSQQSRRAGRSPRTGYYIYGGEAFNTSIKVGSKYYAQAVDANGNPLTKTVGGKVVPVANMAKEIDPSKNVGVRALNASSTVPLSELPKLVASGDAQILPSLATLFYRVNVTKKPFNDVRVREALLLAIDRKSITQSITKGGQVPALAIVPNGMPDALPGSDFRKTSQESFYKDNDIATAKALLAQAGYPNGKGFPAFALLFNTSNLTKTICEAIQGMWKKNLGITCTLRNEELGVFVDDLIHMNFNLALVQWTGDYMDASTFLYMFVTGGGSSHTGWSNKSYDALIAKAKATVDPKARMATLHAAEKILMTDFPVLPIYYCTSPVLLSKHIKNFYQSALGIVDWKNAYMAIDTKKVIELKIGSTAMLVDGSPVVLEAAPIILNSRTLLPIRAVVEATGGTIVWDASAQKVTVVRKDKTLELWIGKNVATLNGKSANIDSDPKVVPIIMSGRTLLPLRFVAEALALDVQWNATTQAITITYTP